MARDPQAALVALNRFGFGGRGGAAGDFMKAASDPHHLGISECGLAEAVFPDSAAAKPIKGLMA
jgi:hypothetical protein